jgi:hypothetical protein
LGLSAGLVTATVCRKGSFTQTSSGGLRAPVGELPTVQGLIAHHADDLAALDHRRIAIPDDDVQVRGLVRRLVLVCQGAWPPTIAFDEIDART